MQVRDAHEADIDSIASVNARAWRFAFSSFLDSDFIAAKSNPVQRAARIRETWEGDHHKLVAVDQNDEVIGFAFEYRPCSLEGYDAEIGALFVDPSANRSGAGSALVREMVRRFKQRGANSMAIHTLTQNSIGCSFYRKMGGQDGPHTTWHDIPSRWFVWPDLGVLECRRI